MMTCDNKQVTQTQAGQAVIKSFLPGKETPADRSRAMMFSCEALALLFYFKGVRAEQRAEVALSI
jgi:hypothetical protein